MQDISEIKDSELQNILKENSNTLDCIDAEEILSLILQRYYCVNKKHFYSSSKRESLVHLTFHMNKLVCKLIRFSHLPNSANTLILKREVAPDLAIYSVELAQKWADRRWTDWLGLRKGDSLNSVIFHHDYLSTSAIDEALLLISNASYALSDICDKSEHDQSHTYHIQDDALLPIQKALSIICIEFSVDLHAAFFSRMNDMISKYLSWR
jgi:hypothetical protein